MAAPMVGDVVRTCSWSAEMREARRIAEMLEDLVHELIRVEVRAAIGEFGDGGRLAPQGCRWLTPPNAAKELGIPVRAIRKMVKDGRIGSRSRNVHAEPKQVKHLVNLDEVIDAARDLHGSGRREAQPESLAEQAARIRAGGTGR